jgi:hypothetical protein
VDNIFSEKQMRLLTEPLHSSWAGPPDGQPFVAMADVGLFHTSGEPPIVPDALLSVGVRQGDVRQRENQAYFVWLRGKTPDVAVEIVSNREGGEDTDKMRLYARIGVPYYVIYDPQGQLGEEVLRVFQLRGRTYRAMPRPWFFEEVGLGLELWQGRYEDWEDTWLRWCDGEGHFIATGAERAEVERQRAIQAEERASDERRERERLQRELEQLREQLRAKESEPPA